MRNYFFDLQSFIILLRIFLEIEGKYIILPSRTGKYSPVLLPDSITVVQATLTRFVLVRIQVRQRKSPLNERAFLLSLTTPLFINCKTSLYA